MKISLDVQALQHLISEDKEFKLTLRKAILSTAIKNELVKFSSAEIAKDVKEIAATKIFINAGIEAIKGVEYNISNEISEWEQRAEERLLDRFKSELEGAKNKLEDKIIIGKINSIISKTYSLIKEDNKDHHEFNNLMTRKLQEYFQEAVNFIYDKNENKEDDE